MIKIGDIEINLINDARIWMDSGGPFGLVPRALWLPFLQPDADNRVMMDHNCLLVRTGGKTIVIETGWGMRLTSKQEERMSLERPESGLVAGLAKLGVKPEDVEIVVNTHLHGDHCGGNTRYEGDKVVPVFPNATYMVQRLEAADATYPNERTRGTYFADNFVGLIASGQMTLIDGDVDIVPGIRAVVTPGHTRGHQSILFEQGGHSAIYVADMASFSVHLANLAWMTAYDVEPLITLETKRVWQKWILEHDALVLFVHDPVMPVARLIKDGEKLKVIPA
jgi:glyoxylase-like metal-dependent hydrolase (beta-lactamase superfamily II)